MIFQNNEISNYSNHRMSNNYSNSYVNKYSYHKMSKKYVNKCYNLSIQKILIPLQLES